MSEVQPRDVLLRCGGRTLHRTGFLAAMGAGRGYVEVKETFTRAAVRRLRDFDAAAGALALGRKATNDKVAIEYPGALSGLVDQAGYPFCGPLLEGARTQLVVDPENFGNWAAIGTLARTAAQADPFNGTGAYLIDSNAAAGDGLQEGVTFTGDGTKGMLLFMRQGTSTKPSFWLLDGTTSTTRLLVDVTWTAGVPSMAILGGTGVLYTPINWGGGWWALPVAANGIVAANGNLFGIYADRSGGLGTVYIFGANSWNAPFPSSYQGPGEAAGAADALTLAVNFGSTDFTLLERVARPLHADAVGALGVNPGLYDLGDAGTNHAWAYFDAASRVNFFAAESGGSVSNSQSVPAGAALDYAAQYDFNATLNVRVAYDPLGGFGSFSSLTLSPLTKYNQQLLRIGGIQGSTANNLFGVLLDCIIARGLRTRAEMLAIP